MKGKQTVNAALGMNFAWQLGLGVTGRLMLVMHANCEQHERMFHDIKVWLHSHWSFRWEETPALVWRSSVAKQVKVGTDTVAHKLNSAGEHGTISKLWAQALVSGVGDKIGLSELPGGHGNQWALGWDEVRHLDHIVMWVKTLSDYALGQARKQAVWWKDGPGARAADGASRTTICCDITLTTGPRARASSTSRGPTSRSCTRRCSWTPRRCCRWTTASSAASPAGQTWTSF